MGYQTYVHLRCPEPRPVYGLGFRNGEQLNFYARSLYWLVRHVGALHLKTEVLADGEPVIFGAMSFQDFEQLQADGRLCNLRRHDWGITWSFREQPAGADDDFSAFPAWRDKLLGEINWWLEDEPAEAAELPELPGIDEELPSWLS